MINNSAGRLHDILTKLKQKGNLDEFRVALGLPDMRFASFGVYHLFREFTQLKRDVEILRGNSNKWNIYQQELPGIEAMIGTVSVSAAGGNYQYNQNPTAMQSLRYIATDLPEEESTPQAEINDVSSRIRQLEKSITSNSELTRTIRNWLLELCRAMHDGLAKYQIRGSRGLREGLHETLGSIIDNRDLVDDVKEEEPSIWLAITQAIDAVMTISALKEKYKSLVELAKLALPWYSSSE